VSLAVTAQWGFQNYAVPAFGWETLQAGPPSSRRVRRILSNPLTVINARFLYETVPRRRQLQDDGSTLNLQHGYRRFCIRMSRDVFTPSLKTKTLPSHLSAELHILIWVGASK